MGRNITSHKGKITSPPNIHSCVLLPFLANLIAGLSEIFHVYYGRSPLYYDWELIEAVYSSNESESRDDYEVNWLLEDSYAPVHVDVRDSINWTPLKQTAFRSHHYVVAGLLKRETPLAAVHSRYDVMEELLDSDAHVDVKDQDGATACVKAVEFGHADAIGLLWRY